MGFQFHTGSIKSNDIYVYRQIYKTFQFHTGSIKSENWAGLGTFLWGFQFHTGSIKSYLDRRTGDVIMQGFNSILVRLKELNSQTKFLTGTKFQFHTGSIKSETQSLIPLPGK